MCSRQIAFEMANHRLRGRVQENLGRIHGIECNPRTTSGLHFFETADIAAAILGS